MTLPAVILAAGASARMGRPKALLDHGGGRSFLAAACAALREAGAAPIFAIVAADAIEQAARACGAIPVRNPAPQRGQVSSMAIALEAASASPAALIALVDQPELPAEVARAMLAAAEREPQAVHVPTFRGERGHPAALPTALAAALREAAAGEGARDVIARLSVLVREHPVDACSILFDVDTPDDLRRWEATR
jgi:CTP:molybdopterin cytidylyltransferase MocA